MWLAVGQRDDFLSIECERIAQSPAQREQMVDDHSELVAFLADVAENGPPTPATPPPPPTTAKAAPVTPAPRNPGYAPTVQINCGPPVSGSWDWYRIEYGYAYTSDARIVEWGVDYGDGKSFVAHDEQAAREDVYWHKYWSPGDYRVTAWVTDEFGRSDQAVCTFSWRATSNNGGGTTGGDLDCEDIGYEVYVGDDDPYGLDGDGDGVGCEGW